MKAAARRRRSSCVVDWLLLSGREFSVCQKASVDEVVVFVGPPDV